MKEYINELTIFRDDENISEVFKRVLIKMMYFLDVTQNYGRKMLSERMVDIHQHMYVRYGNKNKYTR